MMRIAADRHNPNTAARHRCGLAVMVAGLLLVRSTAAVGRESITASDAARHVGETSTVCGTVASAKYVTTSKGQPTFLNLDKAYPEQPFTAVIWGDDRARFSAPPEVAFEGKKICVSGVIETFRGKPQIVVHEPKQIIEVK